ncbi:LOW QUALITY PROTEIN: uncharacterized protein C20orf204 homolog [Pelecanus crispus]|uniref:LOW QUALITY PROTEIN: uncharacterized protein C20orf204 homolog n=1 Tax=Pelecanus crispus TaxID=36300 RepID=UPI003F5D0FED
MSVWNVSIEPAGPVPRSPRRDPPTPSPCLRRRLPFPGLSRCPGGAAGARGGPVPGGSSRCPGGAAGARGGRGRGWAGGGVAAVSRPPPRRPGPSPPTVEPSSNRGPRRSGTRRRPGRAGVPGSRRRLRAGGPRSHFPTQILPRALSCAVLLLLLVAVLSRGKRCSIAKILRQYRAVIFHEIQNLKNLSGSEDRSGRAGPACRSDKDQKILLSIYNISMSLREVAAGTLRSPEELAVRKVARNTDFVLRENCKKISKSPPRIPAQPRRWGPGHRRKQLREIRRKAERLATCWEKLYALHAPRRAPRDS